MPVMTPIAASEITSIQTDLVAAVCDKTCQIYRTTTTRGSSGEPLENENLVATTVAGVTQPTATHLQNYDFLISAEASYLVHLPVATVVYHQDRLVIDGQTLEVHVILTPQSYQVLQSVICAEVK